MNWLQELSNDKTLQTKFYDFLTSYGFSGLEQAMQVYADMQQDYFCNTKTSTSKIKIRDIYYLEIHGHNIVAHTEHDSFRKYGSLNNELKILSSHGFVKCNQSCLVALSKIKTIHDNSIILTNGETVHMTRNYASKVIMAFHNNMQR